MVMQAHARAARRTPPLPTTNSILVFALGAKLAFLTLRGVWGEDDSVVVYSESRGC